VTVDLSAEPNMEWPDAGGDKAKVRYKFRTVTPQTEQPFALTSKQTTYTVATSPVGSLARKYRHITRDATASTELVSNDAEVVYHAAVMTIAHTQSLPLKVDSTISQKKSNQSATRDADQ